VPRYQSDRHFSQGYSDGFGINTKVPLFGGDLFIDDDPKKVKEFARKAAEPKPPRTRFEREDPI